jgi:hypothetical protein
MDRNFGSGRGRLEMLSWYFLGESEGEHYYPRKTFGSTGEIRTIRFPNKSLDLYRSTKPSG